jgi:hypothetical protein
MISERMGNGLGDSLGMSLKYFAQKVTTEIVLKQGAVVPEKDKAILREAAKKVAELAARPIEQEKKRLWYKHNSLHSERPMVVCDPENGWYEIITPDKLLCSSDLGRVLEFYLRKTIFWGEEMKDDTVIMPVFRGHHIFEESSRGFDKVDIGQGQTGSYTWKPAIQNLDDIEKLKPQQFVIHQKETDEYMALLHDIFDGILEVRCETMWWNSCGMTSDLIFLLGMENMLYMLIDAPETIHRLMAFLRDEFLQKFEYVESRGLLCLNNNDMYVGTGGYGWTEELPAPGFDGKVRLCDIWGLSESQETIGISPQMFGEFIYPYQTELQKHFGLNCYGCCEPVESRWEYIKNIHALRRISVSPWADEEFLSAAMGRDYIYSRKLPSSWLAVEKADEAVMEEGIQKSIRLAGRGNLELIMKDNHTIGHNPGNCIRYVEICRKLINSMC